MKSGTHVAPCLRAGRKQDFAERAGFKAHKTKSIKQATKAVSALDVANTAHRSTLPDEQHEM